MSGACITLRDYGRDLASRARARGLRLEAERLARGGRVVIDFAGVRTLSESFADELFAVLVEEKGADWFRAHIQLTNLASALRRVVLTTVSERNGAVPASSHAPPWRSSL